jgi:hypothetical protein
MAASVRRDASEASTDPGAPVSHVRNAKLLPALLGLTVLVLLTGGCASFVAPELAQSKSLQREELDGTPGAMTEAGLREEVLRFANRYMSEIASFGLERVEDTARPTEMRLASLRLTHSLTTSALQISIGPHPVVNLLDMMVLTSLTRQRAETGMDVGGFYRPEDVAALVPSLVRLEADIWGLGARVLAPEQLASLRLLIDEWLRENPDQEYVADIRLDAFAAEHGEDELAEAWAMGFIPGVSLVPEVDRAAAAADEIRLLLERYLVYVQYLPSVLRWESQQAYFQFVVQPEVDQLLANATRVADSSERIAAFVERLPQEDERLRALSAELRQTILAGTELATVVEQTMGSADAFLVGIEERQSPGQRSFDIIDWQNTAVEIGVASRQLNDTLAQINALVSSEGWSRNLPQLIETFDRAESASEQVVYYGFRQSLILIGVFLGGSLATGLVFQWVKRKLFDTAR